MAATLNPTVLNLLRAASGRKGDDPMPIMPREVGAFARYVARTHDDHEFRDLIEAKYAPMLNDFSDLMEKLMVKPLDVEQEYDGVAWLLQNRRKLKLGTFELRVLMNRPRFYLTGFRVKLMGLRHASSPVWTVEGDDHTRPGSTLLFSYCPWSWQTGLKPELV